MPKTPPPVIRPPETPAAIRLSLMCKLASIVGHTTEGAGDDGHPFDIAALRAVTADPEVQAWLADMRKAGLAPLPRK